MNEVVHIEREGAVVTLTLQRPAVLNALNAELLERLETILAELEADASVGAAIITGAGERAFAAGADIGELSAIDGAIDGERQSRRGQRVMQAIAEARFPVIAAVNGFALGGGCELAMACDLRLAADAARFGQPEVNLGLIPGYGGTQRAVRLTGTGWAMLLCLAGEMIDAAEALRIGLVQKVVPAAELLPEARRIAALIAGKAPLAVAAAKRAIRQGAEMPLAEGLALEALQFGAMFGTADVREGTRAFLEKRSPRFSGS